MTSDADREAFEGAWADHASLMEQVEAFADRADFAAGWQAALAHAHARQPVEPVGWINGEVLRKGRSGAVNFDGPTKYSDTPLYTVAHPAPPAPVASEVLDTLIHAVEIIRDVEKDTNYAVDSWTTPESERFTSKAQVVIDRARAAKPVHASDCALHNGPAMMPEPCDCGADPDMTPERYGSEFPPAPVAVPGAWTFADLHAANVARQEEWCPGQKPDLSFRGNELAGEIGEACNVIKKLERERLGWPGSRDTVAHLAEELADGIMCIDLAAAAAGISGEALMAAVVQKFNSVSEARGFKTMLPPAPSPASPEKGTERLREALAPFAAIEIDGPTEIIPNGYASPEVWREDVLRARAALASLPAEPEGEEEDENWFMANVRSAAERQARIAAASPSKRATAPKPAEPRGCPTPGACSCPKPAEAITEDAFLWMRERVSAVREEHRRKMNSASDRVEMAATTGDMKEVSINSTESERHREAFVALNVAIGIIDQTEYSALSPAPAAEEFRPTHRHVKRSSEYCVLGEAEAQVSFNTVTPHRGRNARYLHEGDTLTVYQGADGKLWCRATSEFNDGRFAPLTSGEG